MPSFVRDVGEHRLGVADLLDPGDEREHDPQPAVGAGAHQRAQLRAQHLRTGEPEPEAAQAASPAPAIGPAKSELVLVEVERPHRHRLRRHLLDQAPIERVLRVLGGARQRAARQHELRSVQADTLGAVLPQQLQILEELDIGLQPDGEAIRRW